MLLAFILVISCVTGFIVSVFVNLGYFAAVFLLGLPVTFVSLGILFLQYTRQANPSFEELGVRKATEPSISTLSSILASGLTFPVSSQQFREANAASGVSATIVRTGSMYQARISYEKAVKVRRVIGGVGVVYPLQGRYGPYINFAIVEWSNLRFIQTSSGNGTNIEFQFDRPFPCEGYVNSLGVGCVYAPSFRIDLEHRKDTAVMLLEPRSSFPSIKFDKPHLNVAFGKASGKVSLTATRTLQGKLDAVGTGFEWAKVLLYRSNTPMKTAKGVRFSTLGYEETVAELKNPGSADFTWIPHTSTLEPTAAIFVPSSFSIRTLIRLLKPLDATTKSELGIERISQGFVIGDGPVIAKQIRLILHPTRRREVHDETLLRIV